MPHAPSAAVQLKLVPPPSQAFSPLGSIQSITAVLYTFTALASVYLFLTGCCRTAYLACVLVTQTWRIVSEFARADYRGNDHISSYQYVAGITALMAAIYAAALPETSSLRIDLIPGLLALWDPMASSAASSCRVGVFYG